MFETLSLTEAAVVTGLKVKEINKAIDNKVIRISRKRVTTGTRQARRVPMQELVGLQLEENLSTWVSLNARKKVIRKVIAERLTTDFSPSDSLVIRIGSARDRLASGLRKLRHARKMIETSPEIMDGEPIIKGTRIPAVLISEMLEGGASVEDILKGYPNLSREQVELAVIYTTAYPRRGRPPKRSWHKHDAVKKTRIPLSEIE